MNLCEPCVRKLVELEWGRPRHAAMRTDPRADLRLRVLETQAWCAPRFDLAALSTCLRPPRLCPPLLARDRFHVVEAVVQRRRQELTKLHMEPSTDHQGRLLVYFPDADLGTTAAYTESSGFFDRHGAPPWGTWIGYFDERERRDVHARYLLAWVPPEATLPAAKAVRETADACIQWLSEAAVELRSVMSSTLITEPS